MKPKQIPGEMPMYYGAKPCNFEYARQNRAQATEAEATLWEALKDKKLDGYKFRRQHPIGRFIVDFYCHAAALVIEVDGAYHNGTAQQEYDQLRTQMLLEAGIREIRFTNDEVLHQLETVLECIKQELK